MTIQQYMNRRNKRLSMSEILIIEDRINEINKLLDLDLDDNICDNIIQECERYETILKQSLKATQIAEIGLKII